MFFILRLLAIIVFILVIFVFGCGYCLISPRNPKNLYVIGHKFGALYRIFGIKLQVRKSAKVNSNLGPCVYIANHQNNWDLVTTSNALQRGAVTVGKKSLIYVPFFGPLYWLTGNILIDRKNRTKAVGTIGQVVDKITEKSLSVWLFPEGTRSRGRGLLPFKKGAFHAAVAAGVPIVPIVCSSTDKLSVHRGNNGHVIVELLDPISTEGYDKGNVGDLSDICHKLMKDKLAELDAEVAALNQGQAVLNKQ
ncbi:1-acyl-sn-glycerol-3-phosphate acyltransferase [Veronia nyctiphanis]|uniref:1-acyl-sn-glycerol-3-phosphate acyltransferase n=1 Tax=Veronia nyctiphanis TaxID=1278244 RepID=A0A4Q0YIL3_9GAMM|nr:1-acylglycerol-3-phosphate O-acyltransferase [Veronia nyctiphanis]RXJ70542.1 1-acyl-sn-glycerol-3-phosphate acyltransferase [Veronia nyctiphanis]